ncbi:MAG: multidrug efflux SMR transporter [Dehalococcoidia bacterium]|jgi:small multidrug resistance pump
MGWLILFVAIGFEVAGTTCMKLSEGFSKIVPSVLIFVFYGISFFLFALALKKGIGLAAAYAIWCGVGISLITIIGILHFKEPVTALKMASIALIIAGVVGLSFAKVTG